MTGRPDIIASTPVPVRVAVRHPDHRGSWIPSAAMITTRFMELRKRRGLMITLILVTVGIPAVFLAIRLLLHGVAPKTYGPAGGYSIYTGLVSGVLFIFGFIVAATLGATAGSADLTDGMFRHLVVTGRSRLALYLARIPAGLADHRALGRGGLHHRLRGLCVRGADPPQFQRRERARQPVERRPSELGRRPCRRGHLRLRLPNRDRHRRSRRQSTPSSAATDR